MSNEQLENGPKEADTNPTPAPLPPPPPAVPANPLPALPAPLPEPPFLPRRRRPRGRVARLPLQVRNLVNHALRDGAPHVDILGLLAAHGFTQHNRHDIMAWSKRGYRDWLAEQERFDHSRAHSERAAALLGSLREDGRSVAVDLNESLLADQFSQILQTIDEASLKRLLADKPDDFFRLAKVIASFTAARAQREQIQLQRLKYELEMRKIQERHASHLKPRGLTIEMRNRIEAAAKLL